MKEDFLIKKLSHISENEFNSIGFENNYINAVIDKYDGFLFKIFSLTPIQATILKQTALSCGTDCGVHREVLTHNIEKSDAILFGSKSQIKQIIKKLYSQPFKLKILAENLENILNNNLQEITIREKIFDFKKTYLMGILNYTDNSFSDGGEFNNIDNAVNHFNKLINDGADIIDIGAESTAPDNSPTNPEEEKKRIKEILPILRKNNIPISIDTRNSIPAKTAIEIGADIINDVSGLTYDEQMVQVISNSNAFIVLTFDDVIEKNTVDETIKGLIKRVDFATNNSIKTEKIILDVGIGFNKTYEQNFELIKYADEICSLGFPVLYGISRKSFIQKATELTPKETEFANVSIASYLASKGVNILRVHDVLAHKIAFNALDKVLE